MSTEGVGAKVSWVTIEPTDPRTPVVIHLPEPIGLRDYFAAKAMAALIAGDRSNAESYIAEEVAEDAYLMADAMLAERIK